MKQRFMPLRVSVEVALRAHDSHDDPFILRTQPAFLGGLVAAKATSSLSAFKSVTIAPVDLPALLLPLPRAVDGYLIRHCIDEQSRVNHTPVSTSRGCPAVRSLSVCNCCHTD